MIEEALYHKGADKIWEICVRDFEKEVALREAHCGIDGGHYAGETTAQKIWNSVLWWPRILKDAINYYRRCDLCQRVG